MSGIMESALEVIKDAFEQSGANKVTILPYEGIVKVYDWKSSYSSECYPMTIKITSIDPPIK